MFRRVRRSLASVNEADQALVRRSAALPRSAADQGLKSLSHSANRSGLWFAVAALLAMRKGQQRRAGLRGIAAIAIASTSASLVAKRLFPRRRPAAELMAGARGLRTPPTSSPASANTASRSPTGAGLVLLVNPDSGAGDHDPCAEFARLWPAARILEPEVGVDLVRQLTDAVADPWVRALGVAGGDGTVAAQPAVAGAADRDAEPLRQRRRRAGGGRPGGPPGLDQCPESIVLACARAGRRVIPEASKSSRRTQRDLSPQGLRRRETPVETR
ncbi:acylglycerol kinase family protein [Solihabitans fulvus]|uniref:acylglycerol kinase family protein n=1 Tax=Solihabitans fulvus TaxID=1892852 RepID=UPI001CB766C6|nr:acylglycerol kinase family protein [Solihabitans fulvus]